jgi:hypothetical protein
MRLPKARELVAVFGFHLVQDCVASDQVRRAQVLCQHHIRQWEAEDQARSPTITNDGLAGIKRNIDAMNLERSRLIDEIDEHMPGWVYANSDLPMHTETFGSVVDRLCIAWVRAEKIQQLRRKGGVETAGRAAAADHQLRQLGVAYDTLVIEVAAGKRRLPDWRLLKSYGETYTQ